MRRRNLINITVRPGYNFASAGDALTYGRGICGKTAGGRSYGQIVNGIEGDFATDGEFQAEHLISQAVNELCPQLIWQIRNAAANYRPAT